LIEFVEFIELIEFVELIEFIELAELRVAPSARKILAIGLPVRSKTRLVEQAGESLWIEKKQVLPKPSSGDRNFPM
jgi:hypothetical protein